MGYSSYKPKPVPPLSAHAARGIAAITAAPYGVTAFKRFAKLLGLKIHRYQSYLLGLHFDGVTELVIIIPKKNGKTTLMAALALYHLLMVEKAECVIGASSRDQATILFQQAANLVTDAGLQAVFTVKGGYRIITHDKGRIRVLAADADTADGVIPTLALVDELHRHPSGALYGVFFDGLVGGAQMITISTAGTDIDSPLGRLLTKARTLKMTQLIRRRTYVSPNGAFALVEWTLDADDDPHNMTTVKKANPAPWHTPATLRRRHDSPSMTDGQWLRFACDVWTSGEESPIDAATWDRGRVDLGQIEDGEAVFLAPSVGHNAAIAIAARRPGGRVAVKVEHLDAEDGLSILTRTEAAILALAERFHVVYAFVPRGGFVRVADALREGNVAVTEFPHVPSRLAEASGTLNMLLKSGKIAHDGEAQTREQMLAAMVKTNETGERYMPSDRARAVIAVAVACHAATAYEPEPYIGAPSVVG